MSNTSTEISTAARVFNDDALASIDSFETALAALSSAGVAVENMADYGNGFDVLDTKNKKRLVGVPFIILEWRFNESDMSDEPFVSCAIVTSGNEKMILNDGSTGIRAQLARISSEREKNGHAHPYAGLAVPAGLTLSQYTHVDENGKETPAETFYLSEASGV